MPKTQLFERGAHQPERIALGKVEVPSRKELAADIEATQKSLTAQIEVRHGGDTKKEVAAPASDVAIQSARKLYDALRGNMWAIGKDDKLFIQTLRAIPPGEMSEVVRVYSVLTDGKRDLLSDIQKKFSDIDLMQAAALLHGDVAKADALALRKEFSKLAFGSKKVEALLLTYSPEHLQAVAAQYEALTSHTLLRDAAQAVSKSCFNTLAGLLNNSEQEKAAQSIKRLGIKLSGKELGEATHALATGNKPLALAILADSLLHDSPVNLIAAQKLFYDTTAFEREQMQELYQERYKKPLSQSLQGAPQLTKDLVSTLLTQGALQWQGEVLAQLLTKKPSSDGVVALLKDHSRSELLELDAKLQAQYGTHLQKLTHEAFSGRARKDVIAALQGAPETLHEGIARLTEHGERARGGIAAKVAVTFSGEKKRLLKHPEDAPAELLRQVQEDGVVTENEARAVIELTEIKDAGVRSGEYTAEQLAATGGRLMSVVAGGAVVVATGGVAAPAVIGIAAAAGSISNVAGRAVFDGASNYNHDEIGSDLLIGGAIGATTAAVGLGAQALQESASSAVNTVVRVARNVTPDPLPGKGH